MWLFIFTLLLYLIGTGLAAFVTGHHTGWLAQEIFRGPSGSSRAASMS